MRSNNKPVTHTLLEGLRERLSNNERERPQYFENWVYTEGHNSLMRLALKISLSFACRRVSQDHQ